MVNSRTFSLVDFEVMCKTITAALDKYFYPHRVRLTLDDLFCRHLSADWHHLIVNTSVFEYLEFQASIPNSVKQGPHFPKLIDMWFLSECTLISVCEVHCEA